MSLNQKLGKCGVYCGQCRSFTGEMTELASKIKDWTVKDYSWLKDADENFDYELETVKRCILNENITEDTLKSKSGVVTMISENIMLRSGFQQIEIEEL